MSDLAIRVSGRRFRLLPERALYWEAQRMLVIADAHFGKGETFRRRGIAVPPGTTADDLQRLDGAIDRVRPEVLMVLGDLFHAVPAAIPRTIDRLAAWRRSRPGLAWHLVSGNHDRRVEAALAAIGIDGCSDRVERAGVVFVHEAPAAAEAYTVSGHVHPAVRLCGRARSAVDLPCFWFRPDRAVLPAFGGFTGCSRVRPGDGDRIYAVAAGEVLAARCA